MAIQASDEIAAMRSALDGYQWETLEKFRLLIDELDVRASRIQGKDNDWDRIFRDNWEALEEAYAVMADRSMPSPDAILTKIIYSSLNDIKILLKT